MPRHDYSCPKCKTVEERNVKFADFDKTQACNQCGGPLSRNLSLEGMGVVWNCSGGTRGFSGGGRIPATPGMNPGHRSPTLADLGLTNEQGASIGIK